MNEKTASTARAELSHAYERGREFGASFLPPTERQGAAIRTILIASTDKTREPRTEE